MGRVAVVGLDGLSWELVDALGPRTMPYLTKLKEDGMSGINRSTIPPHTAPAWISFATGCNPGKHGCLDFVRPKASLGNLVPISSNDIRVLPFYEVLETEGRQGVYINLPCSFPPRIGGVMVTSLLTRGDDFAFPRSLRDDIPLLRDYRIVPDDGIWARGDRLGYVDELRKLEDTRFRVAQELWKRDWEVFFILFSASDWIQHKMHGDLLKTSGGDIYEAVRGLFRDMDAYLGWIRENLAEDDDLLVLSDHGFKRYKGVFAVNMLLEELGMCKTSLKQGSRKGSVEGAFAQKEGSVKSGSGLYQHLFNLADRAHALDNPLVKKMAGLMPKKARSRVKAHVSFDVASTKAVMLPSDLQGIFVNDQGRFDDGTVPEAERKELARDLVLSFNDYKAKDGRGIFGHCLEAEEVYWGKMVDPGPDVLLTLDEYNVSSSLQDKIVMDAEHSWHSYDGVYVAYGPGINAAGVERNVNIIDFAPTILDLLGVDVPSFIDGRSIAR